MSLLYRPVLIESAEQAEALPAGTLAYLEHSTTAPDPLVPNASCPFVSRSTASKAATNWWLTSGNAQSDAEMVGWTALVPIEVEVEHIRETAGRRRTKTLYVTPWQLPADPGDEAQALADCGDQA